MKIRMYSKLNNRVCATSYSKITHTAKAMMLSEQFRIVCLQLSFRPLGKDDTMNKLLNIQMI